MSVRPPKSLSKGNPSPLMASLEHEMFVERAETLIRVTKTFEKHLAALKAMAEDDPERPAHSAKAAHALWMLAVQRDCMGLPGTEDLIKDYDVPADIRLAAGVVTEKPKIRWRR